MFFNFLFEANFHLILHTYPTSWHTQYLYYTTCLKYFILKKIERVHLDSIVHRNLTLLHSLIMLVPYLTLQGCNWKVKQKKNFFSSFNEATSLLLEWSCYVIRHVNVKLEVQICQWFIFTLIYLVSIWY